MPGIAGMISRRPPGECHRVVGEMVRSMVHDRACGFGTYSAPELQLYAGWVSADAENAGGPLFHNERGDTSLLFAGEYVPEPSVRTTLISHGHDAGTSPREWLVHLYEELGSKAFARLDGFFAGILVDKRSGRAYLFNDRYGIHRLYSCETDDAIYFASEAKALLRVVPESRAFDRQGLSEWLTFGCTTGTRTLFRGIHALAGASVWCVEAGSCMKGRYFVPAEWETQGTLDVDAFDREFQETFTGILPRYFESESPIAIALTGGLDTRMMMACRPVHIPIVSYTYAGSEGETLDVRVASRVAKACGIDHTIIRLDAGFLTDFASHADKTVYATDGTAGITLAHELFLSARAREIASVRLTGVFGGELLRRISGFKPLGLCPELLDRDTSSLRSGEMPALQSHPLTTAIFDQVASNLFGSLAACRSQLTFRTPYLDNRIVALAFRAPAEVMASADASVRFILRNDPGLAAIATDRGLLAYRPLQSALRRFVRECSFKLDYLCNEGLPHWLSGIDPICDRFHGRGTLLGSHKFLRYRRWFRRELAPYVREGLNRARHNPLWNRAFLDRMADEHVAGRRNHAVEINAVLTLEAVDRLLLNGGASAATGATEPARQSRMPYAAAAAS